MFRAISFVLRNPDFPNKEAWWEEEYTSGQIYMPRSYSAGYQYLPGHSHADRAHNP